MASTVALLLAVGVLSSLLYFALLGGIMCSPANTRHSNKSSGSGQVCVFKENLGLNRWKLKLWWEPENLRLLNVRHNQKSHTLESSDWLQTFYQ